MSSTKPVSRPLIFFVLSVTLKDNRNNKKNTHHNMKTNTCFISLGIYNETKKKNFIILCLKYLGFSIKDCKNVGDNNNGLFFHGRLQVRCLGLLAMPTFCDKSGQKVLITMVFAYIMAGPLNNITKNGSEVIRVFTCSGALVANLTKIRYELMFKPFQEALFGLRVRFSLATNTLMRSMSGL